MIVRVIPAVRLPHRAAERYDYLVPPDLTPAMTPGSLVIVPFAGRTVPGIVAEVIEASTIRDPKGIIAFAEGCAGYPSYVPALWERLAHSFATTLPRLAWAALPWAPARARADYAPGPVGRDGQELVMVPTVREAYAWVDELGGGTVYHAGLRPGERYRIACAVSRGEVGRIVGTKSAVFLPFPNLTRVRVLHAGSSSYVQEDADPRYDARVIACELARASGAAFETSDALLPLPWYRVGERMPVSCVVHDLADAAKRAEQRVLVAGPLVDALDRVVGAGGRALILLNRRGISTGSVCKDCGSVVLCPGCAIPLSVHEDRASCTSCERDFPLPGACARCRGTGFKSFSAGSKALASLLMKRYPGVRLVHLDRDELGDDLGAAQVIVGTSAVFRALPPHPEPFTLVADAFMGAGTGKAGVWSVEETARSLRTLAGYVAPGGTLHVQTMDTSSPALRVLSDPDRFVRDELAERAALGYPPARELVTLLGAGAEHAPLWEEAVALAQGVRSRLPEYVTLDPAWGRPKRFRGKFRVSIDLKSPRGKSHHALVQSLPRGWAAQVRTL